MASSDEARLAREVASFISDSDLEAFPEAAVQAAEDRLVDTIAVGLAGSTTDVARRVRRSFSRHPGGESLAWGSDLTLGTAHAALVNSVAVHAEDYDDTHTHGVVHGSACVVPASWAVAEEMDVTVAEVLRAVVIGWEIAARVGIASRGAFHRRGLHTTSIAGVFGAAASAAALGKLDPQQTIAAIGLAGSAAGGLNVYLRDGTEGKLLNPGFATQAGVQAAFLAREGVTGPAHVFDGPGGVFDALGDGSRDVADTFGSLGRSWEVTRVSTKPFPACHFAHSTIDAAIRISEQVGSWQEIERIQARLPEPTWDLLVRPWEKKLDPASEYSTKFSAPWLIALAMIDKRVTRASFAPGILDRADVRSLAQKVEVEEWQSSPYPQSFPGWLEATTTDGRTVVHKQTVNRGHLDSPLSRAELDAKVTDCLEPTWSDGHKRDLLELLRRPTTSVRECSELLKPPVAE